MTMKKKILTTLSVVLILGLAALGILAYLMDEDSDVNVMTLGNVQIDQIEQEWNADKTELVDFTQAKPLYPYVGSLGWSKEEDNDGAYRTFTMNNVVDKYVSVKNTGKSEAYVRTIFAFEMGDYATVNEFRNKIVGFSRNVEDGVEFKFPGAWVWGNPYVEEIDGQNFMVWEAVYKEALAPGETTIPSLLQVYMNPACGNDEVAKVDGNGNGTYDIKVKSQAIQVAGFEVASGSTYCASGALIGLEASVALDTGFGTVEENAVAWFNEAAMKTPEVVGSYDELYDALAYGGKVTLDKDLAMENYLFSYSEDAKMEIDLNGKTITADSSSHLDTTLFVAQSGGHIVINGNGVVDMNYSKEDKKEYCQPFYISSNGQATINGGTYLLGNCDQKYHIFTQNSGKTIINGGKFITSDPDAAIAYCINGFIEINGGFFQNTANPDKALLDMGNNIKYIHNQKITLSGGTFVNWNPMDSAFAKPWTNPDVPALIVLADGCEVVSETQDNGDVWYSVVPK